MFIALKKIAKIIQEVKSLKWDLTYFSNSYNNKYSIFEIIFWIIFKHLLFIGQAVFSFVRI